MILEILLPVALMSILKVLKAQNYQKHFGMLH